MSEKTPLTNQCSCSVAKTLLADIESEKAAIHQYQIHIKAISDDKINAVLSSIIQDEEYHILILQNLLKETA